MKKLGIPGIFTIVMLIVLAFATRDACFRNRDDPGIVSADSTNFESVPVKIGEIERYDFSASKGEVSSVELTRTLKEASGLTFTHDGRLLCHNDEAGMVFEIDYRSGEEIKKFYLGMPMLREDFEGIAVKQDTIFLVNSSGDIFRFREGRNDGRVDYDLFKTDLSTKNDVEGLTYDPETDCLLLACKGDPGEGFENSKAVYSFSLKTYRLNPQPRFVLSLDTILHNTGRKEFNPSAIERHPATGNFFILAYNGYTIVEIDRDGNILGISEVDKKANRQPEGLAIASDGTIIIGNEGRGKKATLTVYSVLN